MFQGVIAHIIMDVPWRHLSTKPVRLSIKGVRLKCGLRADWQDTHDLLRIESEIRRAEIELREFLQQQLMGIEKATARSYWQNLGLRVAENLQVCFRWCLFRG